jgi:hypothetical protein
MNDYIYPVTLDYDRELLYEICHGIKQWPRYTSDGGQTFFSTHRDIVFPINLEAIRIKNRLLESTTYSFSYVPPGHETGWHTDYTRGCTLILPIDQTPHLIKFKINEQDVEYYYSTPVLTNAKTWHNGVNYSHTPRFNLLFHFDKSYEHVVEMAKTGKLVTEWMQDYNICQQFDSDMLRRYFVTHNNVNTCDILITDDLVLARQHVEKFVIFIGDYQTEFTTIIISTNTKHRDIVQAVKYMLDSPCAINCISIGE